jgi:hypothetical protein
MIESDKARLQDLRREFERRADLLVRFHHWDPYILGEDHELRSEVLRAGEVARREFERWRCSRFPSIQLAVADAVFSKRRGYMVAVRTGVRPFAREFGRMPLVDFLAVPWVEVFMRTFGEPPADALGKHGHLSSEGRVKTIVRGASVLHGLGLTSTEQARAELGTPRGEARVRDALGDVWGLGPALQANILMNLGRLTVKADVHVIRVLAPYLGLEPNASPSTYERALTTAAPQIGMDPFVIDQIVWYTSARSGGASSDTREQPSSPKCQR